MKKQLPSFWLAAFASLSLTACTTTITNLTPSTERRSPNGLYPIEVELDTREQCIKEDTLKPYVLVGAQSYPMQPTLMLKNRWEAVVPVPGNVEYVNYRFKFDYDTRGFGNPIPGSKLSRPYQLQIVNK
jgi:hypothetical protein